jgi:hypothetical protein
MGTFLDLARSRYIDPFNFYFIYFLTKNIAYDLLPRMGSKRSIKSAYRFVIGIRVFGTSCLRTLLWSPVLLRFWGVGCISQFSPICKVLPFWFGLFLIPPPKKLSSTKKEVQGQRWKCLLFLLTDGSPWLRTHCSKRGEQLRWTQWACLKAFSKDFRSTDLIDLQ